jgi:hypothetical protein
MEAFLIMEEHLQDWREYDSRLWDDISTEQSRLASPPSGGIHRDIGYEGPFLVRGPGEATSEGKSLVGKFELGKAESAAERGVPEFEPELSKLQRRSAAFVRASGIAGEPNSPEVDPYAEIRSAMAPEHANLDENEIAPVFGPRPAMLALHQLVNSPEMRQATLASLLGKAGRRSVKVNGSDVSIPSYLRLISRLSGEVAEQSEAEVASNVSPVVCTWPPALVINGYSEYANKLDAAQRALLTSVAQRAVDSFATSKPIVDIRVVGHADTALRKPIQERSKFEMDVSIHRAQSATEDLHAEIIRLDRGRNPALIKCLDYANPVGMGSTKKVVSNPQSEAQMKKNRRVEIYFGRCTVPTQWTWIDTALRGLAIVAANTEAQKRVRCVLELLLRFREKADDGYLDYQNWKGLYFPSGFTEEQKERLLRNAITHLETQLGVRSVYGPASEVSDGDFISALESVDEVITRSIRDFRLNAEAGGAGASVLIVRGWRLIQSNRLNPNSIYSCYASYSW